MAERLAVVPQQEVQKNQKGGSAATETRSQKNSALRVEGDRVRTYTKPGSREMTADMVNGIGSVKAPLEIIGGLALMPFTAGLSAALIADGAGDYAGNGYAKSDQDAQRNKRLLYEAQSNKHDIVINETPKEPGTDLRQSSEPIPLKPGYVEIISHDPETKKTVVNVKHEAFPHEAAVFVAPKKKEAKDEKVTREDVALAA